MAQLTIELPDNLASKMRARIEDAGYSDRQEYIRDLIEADVNDLGIDPPDRVVVRNQEELEAKLLEGLNSGPAVEMTAADWSERRRKLTEKYSKRTAT
jgi:Arc/MetJ-type ribon-helix-helix transcriptional regulator